MPYHHASDERRSLAFTTMNMASPASVHTKLTLLAEVPFRPDIAGRAGMSNEANAITARTSFRVNAVRDRFEGQSGPAAHSPPTWLLADQPL